MRHFTFRFITILLAYAVLSLSSIQGKEAPLLDEFAITDSMRTEVNYVVQAMAAIHYDKVKTEKISPKKFIISYLTALDLNHLFFTQPDINQIYARFENPMISYLEQGSPYPAFEIFKVYRNNVRNRVDWILKRLEHPVFFDGSSTYAPDRKDSAYPASLVESNEVWEQRIKYELLNEMLSDPLDTEKEKKKQKNSEKLKEKTAKTPQEKLNQAKDNVRKRYERLLKTINEFEANEVLEVYLTAYTQMHDPHSNFYSADSLEDFEMSLHSSLVGIGAILSIEDGYCTIKELLAGGPAEKSKQLKPGDFILGVAQGDEPFIDIVGLKLRKAVKLIRGKEGSVIRLLIRPADGDPSERKIVKLVRNEIKLTYNLAQAKLYDLEKDKKKFRIGVIEIPSFYTPEDGNPNSPSTTKDVTELITKLKDMGTQGIILDLRRNGGGFLTEAISLTGLFIPVGPVVQVKDSSGQVREYLDMTTSITWDGPLFILVSRYSASASEIFAGALKNYNRALIVGDETTHGKGTVQTILQVEPHFIAKIMNQQKRLGAVKLTIQKWYLPDGNSTQVKGVPADIVIPSINKYLPIAESDLPNPMPWDSINSIPWTQQYLDDYTDTLKPYVLNALRTQSEKRQETLPEFSILNDNIHLFKEKIDQKEFSLNLVVRQARRDKDNLFNEEVKQRIKAIGLNKEFEGKEIRLESVKAQEGSPDEVIAKTEEETDSDDDDGIPHLDIDERESLRIMADYLSIKASTHFREATVVHNSEKPEVSGVR